MAISHVRSERAQVHLMLVQNAVTLPLLRTLKLKNWLKFSNKFLYESEQRHLREIPTA